MEPLVSITCITYNHAHFIRDALEGFVTQETNFPFEIIVHDDASTDGTQDILREYERNYPKLFNVIYQKENQFSKTKKFVDIERNFMLPRISGKYVASCEGDDYWIAPDKLQIQVDYMETHPKCVCTYHPVVWTDESEGGRVMRVDQPSAFDIDVFADAIIDPKLAPSVPTCSRMAKTDIGKEWPHFRQIASIGDLPAKFMLSVHGYFHYIPKVMGVYRWNHPGSYNHRYKNDRDFTIKEAVNALCWLYEFSIYAKKRFNVPIGRVMLYQVLQRLDSINAVQELPWLLDVIVEAHGKKDKLVKLEKHYNEMREQKPNNKFKAEEKEFKAAEEEYYSWFINAIGEAVTKAGI